MVLAAPLPSGPGVNKADIKPGYIFNGRPRHLKVDYPRARPMTQSKHPLIALTLPNAHGYVTVALISHAHPKGTNTKLVSDFNMPSNIDVNGRDHRIDLQTWKIHQDKLENLSLRHPLKGHIVEGDHLSNLQSLTGTAGTA